MINIPEEIKELLKKDSTRKNFRVHFPNCERTDIINDNIVAESVSFTESICSQSQLKFGLAESPHIEFETFGVGNMKGMTIECSLEVQCDRRVEGSVYKYDIGAWIYSIPYGTFVVASSKRQSINTTNRKVIAYANNVANLAISKGEKMKEQFPCTTDTPYVVDLQKTVLAMCNLGMQRGIYTDLPLATNRVIVWNESTFIGYISYAVICKAYRIANVAESRKLFRVDAPDNYMSDEDICAEIGASGEAKNALINAFKPFVDYEISTAEINTKIIPSDSSYVYPDLSLGTSQSKNFLAYVCVPYQVIYSSDEGLSKTVTFRETEGINIQEVTLENPLGINLSIKRTKYEWKEDTGIKHISYLVPDQNQLSAAEVIKAYAEINGRFIRTERDGSLSLFALPASASESYDASMISDVWVDDGGTKPYGRVYAEYTNTDGIKANTYCYMIPEATFDETKHQTYNISSNYIIQKNTFTEPSIMALLETFASNLEDKEYMPYEMVGKAFPNVQSGDKIKIVFADGQEVETYVFNQTVSGIQNLTSRSTAQADTDAVDYSESLIQTEEGGSTEEIEQQISALQSGKVDTSRTVNGKALNSDIELNANDVGALPNTTVIPTVNASQTISSGTKIGSVTVNGTETEFFAPTHTDAVQSVNGKTGAVNLSAADVEALPSNTHIPTVSVERKLATGTNIASITIDGTETKLYAPSGGGGGGTEYYQAGDTFAILDSYICGGFLSGSNKDIHFQVSVDKSLENISTIRLKNLVGGARVPQGGYINVNNVYSNSTVWCTNGTKASGIASIVCTKVSNYAVRVAITLSAAAKIGASGSSVNNVPISMYITNITDLFEFA